MLAREAHDAASVRVNRTFYADDDKKSEEKSAGRVRSRRSPAPRPHSPLTALATAHPRGHTSTTARPTPSPSPPAPAVHSRRPRRPRRARTRTHRSLLRRRSGPQTGRRSCACGRSRLKRRCTRRKGRGVPANTVRRPAPSPLALGPPGRVARRDQVSLGHSVGDGARSRGRVGERRRPGADGVGGGGFPHSAFPLTCVITR